MIGILRAEPMPLKDLIRKAKLTVPDVAVTIGCRSDYLRKILNGNERGGTGLMKQLEQLEKDLKGEAA